MTLGDLIRSNALGTPPDDQASPSVMADDQPSPALLEPGERPGVLVALTDAHQDPAHRARWRSVQGAPA